MKETRFTNGDGVLWGGDGDAYYFCHDNVTSVTA